MPHPILPVIAIIQALSCMSLHNFNTLSSPDFCLKFLAYWQTWLRTVLVAISPALHILIILMATPVLLPGVDIHLVPSDQMLICTKFCQIWHVE